MGEAEVMARRDQLIRRTRRAQVVQGKTFDEELEGLRLRLLAANDLLDLYEEQVEGLQSTLEGYQAEMAQQLSAVPGQVNALLGNSNPSPEANTPKPGTAMNAARTDHTHERLSATFAGTTSATTAEVTVIFTRTFEKQPALSVIVIEAADLGPVSFKVLRWLKPNGDPWGNGALYGGAQLMAYRDRPSPVLAQVGVLALLAGVITGLNNALALLSGRKNWEPAVSTMFTGFAIASSQP